MTIFADLEGDNSTFPRQISLKATQDGALVVSNAAGSSTQSAVDFVDELYTVIQAWTGVTVGATVTYRRRNDKATGQATGYWVNASDVTIADPPTPARDYVETAFPAKSLAVLFVVDEAGVVWRQFTNTATGGVAYYPINAATVGTPTGAVRPVDGGVVASDGRLISPDASAQALTYDAAGNVQTISITQSGSTYVQSITWAANKITSISQWVKQ